jgi:hypothetical protein|nr:MAG TPA: hypothetical protein [Caudoviricetes sp.]
MNFSGEVEITTLADHLLRIEAEVRYEDTGIFKRRIELTDYHIIRAEVIRNGRRRPVRLTGELAELVVASIDEQIKNARRAVA